MVIVAPAMEQIYELLALLVALYFPVAMVAWLVIDKFIDPSDGKARVTKRQSERSHQNPILADHSQREG